MPRSVPARLRVALLSVLGACAALELAWRAYLFGFAPHEKLAKYARLDQIPAELRRYRPHAYLAYCLNEEYRGADGMTRHNALGFRGADLARERGVAFYDLAADMPVDPAYWADGRHTSERGARAKAEHLAAAIESRYFAADGER